MYIFPNQLFVPRLAASAHKQNNCGLPCLEVLITWDSLAATRWVIQPQEAGNIKRTGKNMKKAKRRGLNETR